MTVHTLQLADWPTNVLAGYTTRDGGVSRATFASLNLATHVGDERDAVDANRRRLAAVLPDGAAVAWLRQVHGTGVVLADASGTAPAADASWTPEARIVCAVLTADCLPVLICAADGGVVAAAHAGWRGLASGVLEATLAALPVANETLLAWLGPCIGPCHFEVGEEVRAAFDTPGCAGADPCFRAAGGGKYFADLPGLARRRLQALGVRTISGSPECTVCAGEQFYSYRRDGETGRMAAFIMRL